MLRVTVFSVLSICVLPSLAARTFDTDDVGTVSVAATELELGSEFNASSGSFGIGLKHGLTPRLDIGLSMGHVTWPDTARAWEGAVLGFKLNLVPDLLSVSFSNELGSSLYSVNGIGSWQMGASGINVNMGGDFSSGEREEVFTWGINPHHDLGAFTVGLELTGIDDEPSLWRVGTQFQATPRLGMDAGLGRTMQGGADWIATLGVWVALTAP